MARRRTTRSVSRCWSRGRAIRRLPVVAAAAGAPDCSRGWRCWLRSAAVRAQRHGALEEQFVDRHWEPEREALRIVDADFLQFLQHTRLLDALGNRALAHDVADAIDGAHHLEVHRVIAEVRNE